MATTTNYAWETPDDTDLVKDGAAAIRTLGSSIDTTTKALNPSTTLGDIEYRSSTANTNTRLGIGTTGQVLTVSGGVPAWTSLSSGAVVQVKSATTSTSASTTTGTPIDTNLSVSITPTSASNRVLVFITQHMAAESSAATPEPATVLQLLRNSTVIWNGGGQYGFYFFKNSSGRTEVRNIVNAVYSDNPATTSAITYKTQFGTGASNVTATVQAMSSTSTITVMEVTP